MAAGAGTEPARVLYARLAMAGVAFVVCGSLSPFRFEAVPGADVLPRFLDALWRNVDIRSRSDLLANVLVMMPVAFCAAGAVWYGSAARRVMTVVAVVVAGGAMLSVSMEFLQTFLPDRVVSLRDVFAETLGACVGAAAWLAIGPAVTEQFRRGAVARTRLLAGDRVLMAYLVVLAAWRLAPFDLSLDPSILVHKYREGRLISGASLGSPELHSILIYIGLCIPVGVAASLFWRPAGFRRSLPVALVLGVLPIWALELSHILMESRAVDLEMLLAGPLGVGVGAVLIRWLYADRPAAPIPEAVLPGIAGTAWMAAIVWSQWYPFNFVSTGAEVLAGMRALTSLSLASVGSPDSAALRAFVSMLPLGFCVRRALGRARHIDGITIAVLALAVVGLWAGVELGISLLPGRTPDITGIAAATCGAEAGLWVGQLGLRMRMGR